MPPRGFGSGPRIPNSDIRIMQSFLDIRYPPIPVKIIQESRLSALDLDWLSETEAGGGDEKSTSGSELDDALEQQSIGMHIMYTKSSRLAALAICLSRKVLVITEIIKPNQNRPRSQHSVIRRRLQDKFLSASSGFRTVAFNAHELVLALHTDMNLACARAVDILSLPPQTRDVVATVKKIAGGKLVLFEESIREGFETLLYDKKNSADTTLAQCAWFAWFIGNLREARVDLMGIRVIDTTNFSKTELDVFAQNMEALVIRELEKPMEETIDVSRSSFTVRGDKASWKQSSYGKRLRTFNGQSLKAEVSGNISLSASLINTNGQQASLRIKDLTHLDNPSIRSVTISGRAKPTRAEQSQSLTILETLQRKNQLLDDRWVKRLFPPLRDSAPEENRDAFDGPNAWTGDGWNVPYDSWASNAVSDILTSDANDDCKWSTPGDEPSATDVQHLAFHGDLNPSQTQAVYDMLNFDKDVSIIQGPPGTGKTTVIAAYVAETLSQSENKSLIIAQSNVAIKNVGEKLYRAGILDWVLIVSSEFLAGWHEHLYEQLPSSQVLSSKEIKGKLHARVVLCTLSMISSPRFIEATRHLHFQSIIVEEASQISMSSYFPLLKQYRRHLKKISFIGDDKQLPPFASESADALQSVFENYSLLNSISSVMLNIQYRMPFAIGDFISREVYQCQLASWDGHPVQHPLCIQFINVNGAEEPEKTSFKNSSEASTCISIASLLHQRQQSFKIITPYETQRDLLELMLENSGLPWSNTCFTVDSFQGNEGDYIIISIVRTKSVGFLQDLRRSNVMLSRAKKGMIICSNRGFLESFGARDTLMGRMAEEWSGIEGGWIDDSEKLEEMIYIE